MNKKSIIAVWVGFMLRTKILELAGFHVFSKWTAEEFADYIYGKGLYTQKVQAYGQLYRTAPVSRGKQKLIPARSVRHKRKAVMVI